MASLLALKQINTGELGDFIDNRSQNFIDSYSGYINSGVYTSQQFSVNTGVSSQNVVFNKTYTGIPRIFYSIIAPSGSSGFYIPFVSNVTNTGATFNYSAILSGVGSTGYLINAFIGEGGYLINYSLDYNGLNNYLSSGNYNLNNTVRTTGDQTIDDNKVFTEGIFVYDGANGTNIRYRINDYQLMISDGGISPLTLDLNPYDIPSLNLGGAWLNFPSKTGYIAVDNELIHNTGNENISGAKTFFNNINIIPAPTSTGHALNKLYGDSTYSTITNLASTGLNLYSQITGLDYYNVKLVGYQRITGQKTFLSSLGVGQSGMIFTSDTTGSIFSTNIGQIYSESFTYPGEYFGNTSICISNYDLFYRSNQIHLVNGRLSSGPSGSQVVTLDWTTGQRILSGDWISDVNPNQSGHIVNKGYADATYYLKNNPSGFITGITTLTGDFYSKTNPSGYITGVSYKSQMGFMPNIDWTSSNYYYDYLSYNTTISFSNIVTGKQIYVTITGAGGYGINWPSSVTWPNGTPSNPSAGVGKVYRFIAESSTKVIGITDSLSKSEVGLNNVDNTSDVNKPISTATQTALNNCYSTSNPSGFITTGQTGQFYPRNNPSGYITGLIGLTGDFYSRTNPSGYITGLIGLTGDFYSRTNPSGFITGVTSSSISDATLTGKAVLTGTAASATYALIPPSITLTGTNTNIDWSLSSIYTQSLTGNTTYTFSNSKDGQVILARITNTGTYTVTWPTIKWPTGGAYVQSTGSKTDVYTFFKDGSGIYGSAIQGY